MVGGDIICRVRQVSLLLTVPVAGCLRPLLSLAGIVQAVADGKWSRDAAESSALDYYSAGAGAVRAL